MKYLLPIFFAIYLLGGEIDKEMIIKDDIAQRANIETSLKIKRDIERLKEVDPKDRYKVVNEIKRDYSHMGDIKNGDMIDSIKNGSYDGFSNSFAERFSHHHKMVDKFDEKFLSIPDDMDKFKKERFEKNHHKDMDNRFDDLKDKFSKMTMQK